MVLNPVQDLNRQNNIINMNKTFALVLGYPQAQNSKWKKGNMSWSNFACPNYA